MSILTTRPLPLKVRCDLCPHRHVRGSRKFMEHLAGRAVDDLAEPTRSEMYPWQEQKPK